jgi:hypothetical protein
MSRRLVVWEAHHDNGWTTTVAEQPGGVFVLRVRNGSAEGLSCEADSVAQACAAALAALARTTGHARCSLRCSEWTLSVGSESEGHGD